MSTKQVSETPISAVMSRSEKATATQAVPAKSGERMWDSERNVETVEWIVPRRASEVLLACSDVARITNVVDGEASSTCVTGGVLGQPGYSARCSSIHTSGTSDDRRVVTTITTATLVALEASRAVIELNQHTGSLMSRAGQWVFDVTPVYGDALLSRVVLTMSGSMTFRYLEDRVRAFKPILVLFCCLACCISSMQDKQLREVINATLSRLSLHLNHYVLPVGTAPLAFAQEVGAASSIAPEADRVAALERLAALRSQHVLTEDEFLAEKKRVLASA
jgi:hypothetical protein